MKQNYWLLLCMLLLLSSCDFSPSGSHYVDINPTPVNDIRIVLNNTTDTLFVQGSVNLEFQLDLQAKSLRAYQVLLDGKIIKQSNQPIAPIYLRTESYSDGPHELKVLLETNTNTQSLADRDGFEYMQVYRTWVLMLDNAPPTPVKFTKIAAEDGMMKLEWEKYNRRNINYYMISRHNSSGSLLYYRLLPPNTNTWADSSYTGGKALYKVAVVGSTGGMANSEFSSVDIAAPKLLNYKYVNDNDLQLTFSSCKLYKNFGRYELSVFEDPELDYNSATITDTVILLRNVAFGADFNVFMRTYPKEPEFAVYVNLEYAKVNGYGKENNLGGISISFYSSENDLFYDLKSASIGIIDPSTMQLSHKKEFQMHYSRTLSPNGQHMYMKHYSDYLSHLSPTTFETINMYNIKEMLPGYEAENIKLMVSNNNKLMLYVSGYSSNDTLYIFDMNTKSLVLKHPQKATGSQSAAFSPDGKMVAAYEYTFHLQADGSWLKSRVTPGALSKAIYHPTAPHYLISDQDEVAIYSTEDGSLIESFRLGKGIYPSYIDQATGYLIAYGNNHLHIYDLRNNRFVKQIKLGPQNNDVRFLKDKLFTYGYYSPIQL